MSFNISSNQIRLIDSRGKTVATGLLPAYKFFGDLYNGDVLPYRLVIVKQTSGIGVVMQTLNEEETAILLINIYRSFSAE